MSWGEMGKIGFGPRSREVQPALDSGIAGPGASHACFKVVQNQETHRAVGVARQNGDAPAWKIPGDPYQRHARRQIGKMGQMGWPARLVAEMGGLGKRGHVGGDHHVPIAAQREWQGPSERRRGFLSQRLHFDISLRFGQVAEISDAAVITAVDDGLPAPSRSRIGPAAVSDESRIPAQGKDFATIQMAQVRDRPADGGHLPLDRFDRAIVEIMVSKDEIQRPGGARPGQSPEVLGNPFRRRDVAGDDERVGPETGDRFVEAFDLPVGRAVKMEVGKPMDCCCGWRGFGVHIVVCLGGGGESHPPSYKRGFSGACRGGFPGKFAARPSLAVKSAAPPLHRSDFGRYECDESEIFTWWPGPQPGRSECLFID